MELVSQSRQLIAPTNLKAMEPMLTKLYQSWETLSVEQREQATQALLSLEQARKSNPLKFLIPNGAQEKVIREAGNLENFIVLACFANGVGKSAIVMAILGAIMWGAPSKAFDYPLYKEYPRRWPKLIRIVTESGLVGHMGPIQVESKLWWPQGRYEWLKGGKQHNSLFVTDTGFQGEVMTYEQAVKEFEGKTVGVNVFVEPPPREILNACFARQRKGGINLVDMTPLMSAAYIKDEIVDKPSIEIDGQIVGKSSCVNADIEENCEEHGKNGQLKHRDILQIISRYDQDEIDARAHGKFMHLSGAIYKTFDRLVHVAKEPIEVPENAAIYQVVDPAIAKPIASIWAFVDASKTIHIYDEFPSFDFQGSKDSNMTVKDYADEFKRRENKRVIQDRIMDRHFGNVRRTLGGPTLKQEFAAFNIDFRDSYSMDASVEVETGILKVKDYLRYDKTKPIDGLNRPRIIISPTCKNTITAFERWSRDPKSGKPQEEYKDFSDVIRYLAMAEPEIEVKREWHAPRPAVYGVGT